jgi:uncharacterized protein (TIGR02231 family)
MQIRKYYVCLPALFFLFPLLLCPAQAAVKEVTFFPNSAKIIETAKVPLHCPADEKCKASVTIPPQADPQSLVVSLPFGSRMKIDDMQVSPVEHRDETKIAELRKQIAKLKQDRKELQARLQALDVQTQFWQMQTKARTKSIAESDNLAAAIGRNVRKAAQEKFAAEAEIEKLDKRSKELQENLSQATGKKETAWEAVMSISGATQSDIILLYNYNLSGCGWLPLYRIEALPAENRIAFFWEAQMWQSSGNDWKQVQINLATLQPVTTVTPPNLRPWIIKPRPAAIYKSGRKEKAAAAPAERNALANDDAEAMAAEETARTTYSLWSLGKRSIPAGPKQRLKIKEESWPAEFLLLARPSVSPQAFVRASVKFEKAVEIPPGEALFLINGAILGKREFSLAGSEGTLFFGTSPSATVTAITLADKSGAKTIFQNRQTRTWRWLMEAKNSGNAGIRLRIEEPLPQARDERIRLTFKSSPEPLERDHEKMVWIMDLAARQEKTIENTMELEAPQDLPLDFGWRR